jgi:hypothetical protein
MQEICPGPRLLTNFRNKLLFYGKESRGMRWAGYAARMERSGMLIGYWWKSQKEKDH